MVPSILVPSQSVNNGTDRAHNPFVGAAAIEIRSSELYGEMALVLLMGVMYSVLEGFSGV